MSDEEYYIEAYGQRIKVSHERYLQHQLNHADDSHKPFQQDRPLVLSVDDAGGINPHTVRMVDTAELTDPEAVRQGARRQQKLTELCEETVTARAAVGTGMNVERVSFEKWQQLSTDFNKCMDEEKCDEKTAANRVGFLPLNRYVHKLLQTRADGSTRIIRAVLVGEVGLRPNGKIVLMSTNPGESVATGGNIVVGGHTKHNTGK